MLSHQNTIKEKTVMGYNHDLAQVKCLAWVFKEALSRCDKTQLFPEKQIAAMLYNGTEAP